MANPYVGTKLPNFVDPGKSDFPLTFSIYKGIIRKIDTGTRSGRVWVYIDAFGGDDTDDDKNWTLVSYASPFGGTTTGPLVSGTNPNIQVGNSFEYTQQTYGFYMTPPDVGNIVLCCFPNGSRTEGYWFACINSSLSKYMVPSIGAVTIDKIDVNSIPSYLAPYILNDRSYPVGEWNDNLSVYGKGADWINTPKPLHIPQTINLINQGLDGDPVRGAISSSAQRDPVSAVFGFSTPGRPWASQDIGKVYTKEAIASGNFTEANVTTRVGGHSLTMDDGDFFGKNNLVRLKTSAGHQIMMNDSEGFIYISNSTGNAWVELTKSGDVLIYSRRDMSVRTEGNLMMHSDKNISFNAGGSFKVHAGGSVNMQAPTITSSASNFLNMYGKQTQLKSGGSLSVSATGGMSIKASGSIGINGAAIYLNGGGGSGSSAPPNPLPEYNLPDASVTPEGFWFTVNPGLQSINYKVPTHEPYIRGNIAAVIKQQEEITTAAATDTNILGDQIAPADLTIVGTNQANTEPVVNPAPTSAFITQTDPTSGIGDLGKDEVRAYMAQIGDTSKGVYNTQDQFGYQGKYGLSAESLQELGYVKTGTPQTAEALSNPNNWTGLNGITSAADFQSSSTIQDQAMYDHTQKNYAALQTAGIIKPGITTDQIAGYLASSHTDVIGVQGTVEWATTGKDIRSLNGQTASAYYNQGRYSQTQVPVITASNNSKIGT